MDEIWLDEDNVDWDGHNTNKIEHVTKEAVEILDVVHDIPGIPRKNAFDDKKRFSFGLSEVMNVEESSARVLFSSPVKESSTSAALKFQRRSFSQPLLAPLTISDDDEPSTSTANRKKTPVKRPKKASTQRPPSSLPSTPAKAANNGKTKKEKETTVVAEFHAVYCLVSRSENRSHKGRCYIGYTVDTNRRIKQHNGGKDVGGAKKTHGRGPWDMVFCVEGFPNSVSGLRFEWASQNPEKSRVLKDKGLKKEKKETPLAFRVRVACHLINSDPWRRLGLTFRWLIPSYRQPFPPSIPPPSHVGVVEGVIPDEKMRTIRIGRMDEEYKKIPECHLCDGAILRIEELGMCISSDECRGHFHLRCLAKKALEASGEWKRSLFPVKANCPLCNRSYRWGDLIRLQHDMVSVMKAHPDQDAIEGRCPRKKMKLMV